MNAMNMFSRRAMLQRAGVGFGWLAFSALAQEGKRFEIRWRRKCRTILRRRSG